MYDVVFGVDDEIFMAAGEDGTVRLWRVEDGELVQSYAFGETIVWDLDLRPGGSRLAVARDDGIVNLIDLNDLDAPPRAWEHESAAYKAVFSPDGNSLGVGTSSGKTYIWDVENVFYRLGATHDDEIYALDFSADSQWMVSGGADSVARATKVGQQGVARGAMQHGDWIEFVEFGPSGDWFATASDDNNLRIWDVETETEKLRMAHNGFVMRMDISPNGAWIASTGYDQTARVWDTVSGSEMMQIPLDARGTAILFSEDSTRLFVGDDAGNLTLWDTSSLLARLNIIEFPELVRKTAYSPSGEYLAVNTDARDLRLLPVAQTLEIKDGTEGEEIIKAEGLSYDIAFSPDTAWVAVEVSRQGEAVLYHLEDQASAVLAQGAKLYALDFSPDSSTLATAGGDGILRFWDLDSLENIDNIENPKPIQAAAYHPEGEQIAVSMHDQIIVWDVASQTKIATLNQSGDFHSIAYSADGVWLAAASSEGAVYLWNVQNNYALSPHLLRMNGEPYALEFSPDGKLLASGSTNKFAYLWDITLGEEIARLPHTDVVRGISFSPDGLELATVARKSVQIWDIPALPRTQTDSLIDTACSHLVTNMSQEEWDLIYVGEEYRLLCPDLAIKE